MLKKFSKFLLISLLIFTLASNISTCFADDVVAISDTSESNPVETSETDEVSTTSTDTEENTTHYGDLYLCDNKVIIDNIVYGNVYVIANTVEITGQIEGNLFVLTNSLKLDSSVNQGGVVGGSIYACANSIYYNGACTYLYTACGNIEMTFDSYVLRDAKILSNTANIRAAIGRDMNISSGNIDFGEGEDIPLIYGNLTYSSSKDVEIPDGIVTNSSEEQIVQKKLFDYSILDIVIRLISVVVTILAIYFILNKFTPNFVEKIHNKKTSIVNILKAFGIGLLSIIAIIFVSILLLVTGVGTKLGIILSLLFAVLCVVSVPILEIVIAKSLKSTLKLEKNSMFILVLCLVSIILYGVTLIPYAGAILNFIIKTTAIGLIIFSFLPDEKGLTDEEMAKKIKAKEEKEKRKQEKLEARKAKKTEKNELNG